MQRTTTLKGLLAATALLLTLWAPLPAATIAVSDTADVVLSDGVCSLREALDNANLPTGGDVSGNDCTPGDAGLDVITLPAGTYTIALAAFDEDANAGGDFDVLDDLELVGAGSDQTFVDAAGLDRVLDLGPGTPGIEVAVRDMQLRNGALPAGHDGGGVRVRPDTIATLSGMFLAANVAPRGGGLFNEGNLEFIGGRLQGNRAELGGDGGGVLNFGTASIETTEFLGNSAEGRGGGILNSGSLIVQDTTFSFETATDGGALFNLGLAQLLEARFGVCHVPGDGGAVHHAGGSLLINDGWFVNNSAEQNGGSIYSAGFTQIRDSLIQGSIAYLDGGAIFHLASTMIVTDTRIEMNQAGERGAAIANHGTLQTQFTEIEINFGNTAGGGLFNAGLALLQYSSISLNFANGDGGAIHNENFVGLVGCLVAESGARVGGGLYGTPGSVTNVYNSTVSGNHAQDEAGGVAIRGLTRFEFSTVADNRAVNGSAGGVLNDGEMTARHSIFSNAGDCVQNGVFDSFGYNMDGDGSCGLAAVGDMSGVNPNLATLQQFGGPTRTHALLSPSPAIDSADPDCRDQSGNIVASDQRLLARPMDGDGDTIVVCDRGAFEAALPSGPLPPVPDGIVGTAMRVGKLDAAGVDLALTWDTADCPADGYHLIYGTLGDVATLDVDGAVCGLDASGVDDWNGSPGSSVWFLVVADDLQHTEGTWGTATSGVRRPGAPSGQCAMAAKDETGTCP